MGTDGSSFEYQLLEKLGEGGMGTVYKVRHARLNQVVALKVLSGARLSDARAVVRFRREMEAVARLDHPNIVRAYEAREIDGVPMLVMEYLEGLTLARLVVHGGRLSIADACEAIRQAALGLDYAAQRGLVHRDIKPSNLMVTSEGQVKILDFGLALLPADESSSGRGLVLGTADYMAPEQVADSHAVDHRADLYSLGCTLHKLLAGRSPFGEPEYTSTSEKMTAHVFRPAPSIRELRPDAPPELAALLERLLAKAPQDRFPTGAELAAALAPLAAGSDLPGLLQRTLQRMQARIDLP